VPALVEIAALAEEGGVEGVPVAEEAIAALGAMSNGPAQDALRAFLSFTETPALRSAAIKALGATKSGATLLLVMAQEGTLPESTEALATTVVHSSAYEDVRLLANKVLPRPKEKGGKDVPPVAELLAAKGDAGRGRQAFFSEEKGNCGRCHRAGKRGSDVGPDLSAIGVKFGREGLFESILSPSAAISHEYKVWIVRTRSVGLVTGYIAEETPEGLTLRDANGKVLKFEKDDVLGRTPSEVSLMPEGLVGAMTALDLVDIVEFLAGQKPAAPAGGGEQGK
jgi:putative heme-binding domain-containing protein